MIFQGRELRIGDNLVSKRHGKITVESMQRKFFTATAPREGILCAWDYEGRYCYGDDLIIDASWPDAPPERAPIPFAPNPQPKPDREAEYRRVWIEVAMRLYCVPGPETLTLEKCFACADAFLAELKRRDGEGL